MLTQHRPHSALAGRRFGLFSGKTETEGSTHPVGVLTQHRPHGAIAGRRYGSFAGKSSGGTEWDLVTPIPTELAGTLSVSGDFAFTTVNPFDITETAPVALSGTLALSGDFGFTIPFDVAETAPLALAGTLAISGEFAYDDTPPPPPSFGSGSGGGTSNNEEGYDHEWNPRRDERMVLDCITALIAAEVI